MSDSLKKEPPLKRQIPAFLREPSASKRIKCLTPRLLSSPPSSGCSESMSESSTSEVQKDSPISTAPSETLIAGTKTVGDWLAFRGTLVANTGGFPIWEAAFEEYFRPRLALRYLDPIKTLQNNGNYQGEGFSIAAIQCTLIEFLESTAQGLTYRFRRNSEKLGPFEYSSSKSIFIKFLCNRKPFAGTFTKLSALDFYEGVRCGLLHEAQTKNGWKVWARSHDNAIADITKRIVYRDNFQTALLEYVECYKSVLLSDGAAQSAFVRKFDSLCGVKL